ncbi:MAG TPA: Ig-like domain-containing protein, partial [Candidatus Acidoferrum sp.]|nr:Ig-like domain-containing protein [Candidatus Acidoferrum sp.]
NTFMVKYSGDASYAASAATGTITALFETTTTLTSSNTTIQAGQNVTLTASVIATPAGGAPITGSVQFQLDGFNVGSPATVVGGQAALTTSSIPFGIHGIVALYSGDGNNAPSGSAPLTETINSLSSMTSVTATSSTSTQGQPITFNIAVAPTVAGGPVPTGALSVQVNGSFAGIPVPDLDANGRSSFTSLDLPVGSDTITVRYPGNTAYTGSSGSTTVTIVAAPDFSVAANPATITVARPGASGSTMLMLTATNGLTGTFTLVPQCTGLPLESSCSVSPAMVTFSSTVTTANVMLTVATTAPSNVAPNKRVHPTGPGMGTALALTLLALLSVLSFLSKRRRFEVALSLIALAALLTIASCGGGGGGGGGPHDPGTPVGVDNNARVSFTLGTASHSVGLSINVQ